MDMWHPLQIVVGYVLVGGLIGFAAGRAWEERHERPRRSRQRLEQPHRKKMMPSANSTIPPTTSQKPPTRSPSMDSLQSSPRLDQNGQNLSMTPRTYPRNG